MGFLDRLRGRDDGATAPENDDPDAVSGSGGDDDLDGIDAVEEIGTRRLTSEEEAALDTVRAGYAEHGIDPADLDSVAAAYDRALDGQDGLDSSAVVEMLGTAVGDHLVVVGGYRWVVSTDPFGTDLAVEPPRRGVPVVTRMLVAVRWMGREQGWIPGVVGHLARAGRG
ncbi:MAG TPA: hypothetical protein VES93_04120 [Ornithinibacter sp.]|nr:hypothetical protein [Ornithinibacter sp.]